MILAYLALGANLGDCRRTLTEARSALERSPGVDLLASSALYETEPVGGPPEQPWYLNAVLQLQTGLAAGDLLQLCRQLEERFGRRRQERWGARTLDLDLLFYGDEVIREPDLTVPHPRVHLRPFVLMPLTDLDPERVHPQLGLTVRQLLARCPATGGVRRLTAKW